MTAHRATKFVTAACLGVVLALGLSACRSDTSAPPAQGPDASTPRGPDTQPDAAGPAAIQVDSKEASVDLGPVQPASKHTIVFQVNNAADKPLFFRTVRGECECINAVEPPLRVEANGSAKITVDFVAPKEAVDYKTRLIILTDSPERKLISLYVMSHPPVN